MRASRPRRARAQVRRVEVCLGRSGRARRPRRPSSESLRAVRKNTPYSESRPRAVLKCSGLRRRARQINSESDSGAIAARGPPGSRRARTEPVRRARAAPARALPSPEGGRPLICLNLSRFPLSIRFSGNLRGPRFREAPRRLRVPGPYWRKGCLLYPLQARGSQNTSTSDSDPALRGLLRPGVQTWSLTLNLAPR